MSDSLLSKPLTRESVDRAITALESRIERVDAMLKADPESRMASLLREGLENDKKALLEMRASLE